MPAVLCGPFGWDDGSGAAGKRGTAAARDCVPRSAVIPVTLVVPAGVVSDATQWAAVRMWDGEMRVPPQI